MGRGAASPSCQVGGQWRKPDRFSALVECRHVHVPAEDGLALVI